MTSYPAPSEDYFDVVAVNIKTGAHRILEPKRTAKDAHAILTMAVMRRGVETEFYKIVPHDGAVMATFTPGPWVTIHIDGANHIVPTMRDGEIAIVRRSEADDRPQGERDANARLVAAAPDLLAALDRLAREVSGAFSIADLEIRQAIGNTNYNIICQRVADARVAITKAAP